MNMTELRKLLVRGWMVVVALGLLGVLSGTAYSLFSPTLYEASSRMRVSIASPSTTSESSLPQKTVPETRARVLELAQSPSVAGELAELGSTDSDGPRSVVEVSISSHLNTDVIHATARGEDPAVVARVADDAAAIVQGRLERDSSFENARLLLARPAIVPAEALWPSILLPATTGLVLGLTIGACIVVSRSPASRTPGAT